MPKNTSIILGENIDKFIKNEIEIGRYSSANEVIRSGLRLLEIENTKIETINKALVVGENCGSPKAFDNKGFKSRMKKKLKSKA